MEKVRTLKISISGVRGVVGESFTPKLACEFSQAFGAYVGRGHVIVGRDTRPSGTMVQHAVHAGLLAVGCKPIDVGILPTPSILIKVKSHRAVGGIAITASHNPNEWNALKFVSGDGLFLNRIQASELLDIYHQGDVEFVINAELRRIVPGKDAFSAHLSLLLDYLDVDLIRRAKLKVAFDCCNGAAAPYTQRFLEKLGCVCFPVNAEPTGIFPHKPEPVPENIGQLCELVKKMNADVGFVQDPDADRLAVVDETGAPIGEDYTLVLATRYVLERANKGQTVVANVSITRAFDDVATSAGARVIHTKIGEINVTEQILAHNALIGGEGNGGVIVPAVHPCRDSFVAMGIVLEAMARHKCSVSALMKQMPRYCMAKEKFGMSASEAHRLVQLLRRHEWENDVAVNTLDGIRLDWPDKWALIRPSNTEPVVRIIAEAGDADTARKLVRHLYDLSGKLLAQS